MDFFRRGWLPGLGLLFLTSVFLGSQAADGSGEAGPPPGDNAVNPGPLASDLSPALRTKAIQKAMRRVGEWQLQRIQGQPSLDWTYSALYDGLIAAGDDLQDARYRDAVEQVGQHFEWKLGARELHADDQAIGKSYLALARGRADDPKIQPMRAQFDHILTLEDDPTRPTWWWCDALYMGPSAWAGLSKLTGDPRYRKFVSRQWEITSRLLWDDEEHLYFRDTTFLDKREKNGRKIFWARGNGWVFAGLAHTLDQLPEDDPKRSFYLAQYKALAARVAGLQGADGLWRPGLLDQAAYPLPETSGSAFFVYGLAWGIRHRLLNAGKYQPVVAKAWKGLLAHVYQNGRLGCVQPIGAAPGAFLEGSSYVYGTGAFLMAGAELDRMSQAEVARTVR